MTQTIAFLHTSPAHIPSFDQLLSELAPSVQANHIVSEAYLDEARAKGMTPELNQQIATTLVDAANDANVVICTCSTIGGAATIANRQSDSIIMRVDRPMADRAVALGDQIVVAATVTSTLAPTRSLLESAASDADRSVTLIDAVAEEAWAFFEEGDVDGYYAAIAEMIRTVADKGDVIVLAQASMAPAADLCPEVKIPILSSPRLAVENALERLSIGRE